MSPALATTYYLVGSAFLLLTIGIIWQTCVLNNIISQMGQSLSQERRRLQCLMYVFSISFLGISVFYITNVATDLKCTGRSDCIRFNALILTASIMLCFDWTPMMVLYIQHYRSSNETLKQQRN